MKKIIILKLNVIIRKKLQVALCFLIKKLWDYIMGIAMKKEKMEIQAYIYIMLFLIFMVKKISVLNLKEKEKIIKEQIILITQL